MSPVFCHVGTNDLSGFCGGFPQRTNSIQFNVDVVCSEEGEPPCNYLISIKRVKSLQGNCGAVAVGKWSTDNLMRFKLAPDKDKKVDVLSFSCFT